MHIVVLTKPVPDPAAAAERLGPDMRLDRAASPAVVNGNDEYALEAARSRRRSGPRRSAAAAGSGTGLVRTTMCTLARSSESGAGRRPQSRPAMLVAAASEQGPRDD